MLKKISLGVLVIVILGGGAYLWKTKSHKAYPPVNPLNSSYSVEGKTIELANGKSELEIVPGSASKLDTSVFGVPVLGDLNGDGEQDAALMLVQSSGGSGTFYYVAAAVSQEDKTVGTNAILLGDRVAPQNIEIKNGQIIANYAEREPGQPMTARVSLGVSKYINLNGFVLSEGVPISASGERCGGNMTNAPVCMKGYHCAPNPYSKMPFGDVGGTCVAD